ncbi:hypothetical protein V1508DRAFT_362604 [Lipomyces doorenjongii]|uniref:uncharacterized protein n=1 Tax=Lipomyces doorenjongii TaxID=383834 RepID=UPI0034CDC514
MTYPVSAASPVFKGDFIDLTLTEVTKVSHDTSIFRFAYPGADDESGLITASAILVKYKDENDKNIIRPYTPITDPRTKGYLDLLVKVYPEGKASKHIHSLKPGDKLAFKGPIIKYPWTPNKDPQIVLIGGGTGLTPLYQLIHEITSNRGEDKTEITLLYGNKTVDDILLYDELKSIAAKDDKFKVYFTVEKDAPEDTIAGFINDAVVKKAIGDKDFKSFKFFVCGPPGLYNAISGSKVSPSDQGELTGLLKSYGVDKEQVFKF